MRLELSSDPGPSLEHAFLFRPPFCVELPPSLALPSACLSLQYPKTSTPSQRALLVSCPISQIEPQSHTHTSVVGVPPSRSSQVESNGEGECGSEDGGDEDRVSLEEGVVDDLANAREEPKSVFLHEVWEERVDRAYCSHFR
jgi:hypothetical protein